MEAGGLGGREEGFTREKGGETRIQEGREAGKGREVTAVSGVELA